jgi:hypothetical protein
MNFGFPGALGEGAFFVFVLHLFRWENYENCTGRSACATLRRIDVAGVRR